MENSRQAQAPSGDAAGEDGALRAPSAHLLMEENALLAAELRDARAEIAARGAELARARDEAAALRREVQRLARHCAAAEELRSDQAKLHVATRALHGTLDLDGVLDALEEVVINLVGSECFAVLEGGAGALTPLRAFGCEPARAMALAVGKGIAGQVARTGQAYVAEYAAAADDVPAACIPLQAGGETVGVLIVDRLLPQKLALTDFDHELFELITVHGGTALHAARLHAAGWSGERAA